LSSTLEVGDLDLATEQTDLEGLQAIEERALVVQGPVLEQSMETGVVEVALEDKFEGICLDMGLQQTATHYQMTFSSSLYSM